MAPKREFESPLDPQSRLAWYINVGRCGGLSIALLQLIDPLRLFVKGREFLPGFRCIFRRDMTLAVESDVKTHPFLPSKYACESPTEKFHFSTCR